jgi:choline dehydrogenase-like flavoprotein
MLVRFSETLLPAGGGLPGAEGAGGVAIGAPVSELLAGAPPRVRLAARLALLLLELSSFPRRFSKLPVARRAAHLERLASRPTGVRHELFLMLKTLSAFAYARDLAVQQAVGARARCELAGGDGAPLPRPGGLPSLDPLAMRPPEGMERCDVVIVGSGAGGAAAARALAEAGLSVIVVEEGDYHDASTYSTDPFEALSALYRGGGLTACEGRPLIPLPVGRCVGGTTVINSGTCFRTPDDVLLRWRDELGIGWATELEREFELLERDLSVKEVDPATAGRNGRLCRAGAEAIGASNGPIARNAAGVVCCGTCPTGCALDAKQAAHVSELPRAAAAGCLVRAGARAERVIVEGGRAVGVSCRTERGAYEVRASAVLLAAGALGTPELLLAQGIAASSGELGRNLRIHPACWVGACFDEPVRGWDGVMQSWYVDEWNDRGLFLEATFTPFAFGLHWLPGSGAELKQRIERYDRLAVIGVHMSDRSSRGRVRVARGRARGAAARVRPRGEGPPAAGEDVRVSYRLSEQDAAEIRFGIARAADIHFAAGAREVYPQVGGIASIGPGDQEAIERGRFRASELRLEAFHPMGTARMGADPRHSVVAPSGEAHDLEGLYVVDASILPTSLRVNPMITIMACARRIAVQLAERLS